MATCAEDAFANGRAEGLLFFAGSEFLQIYTSTPPSCLDLCLGATSLCRNPCFVADFLFSDPMEPMESLLKKPHTFGAGTSSSVPETLELQA